MDKADERARAEMEELERQAKKDVAEGLSQTDDKDEEDDEKPAPSMLDRRR
jgi:hypothetical protein